MLSHDRLLVLSREESGSRNLSKGCGNPNHEHYAIANPQQDFLQSDFPASGNVPGGQRLLFFLDFGLSWLGLKFACSVTETGLSGLSVR
jgi:hypothetical protein